MRNFIFSLLVLFATHTATAQSLPAPDHIVILFEENRNYSDIVGSSWAPYINGLLADTNAAIFTNFYALVTTGSQPNYLTLFSGSTQGVVDNTITTTQFTTCNLGASLIAAGKSFIGYSDSLPSVGFLGGSSNGYARKHNPWSNWQGSGTNQLAPATNQPFAAFPADFTTLPTVSFVVPDLYDDMHTPADVTGITPGDTWLKKNLDAYIQWAKTHNSLAIIGFDESADMGEHILCFVIGQGVKGGYYSEYANYYRILRTIEQIYGLPYCGNSDTASAVTSIWSPFTPSGISTTSVAATTLGTWPLPASFLLHLSIHAPASCRAQSILADQLGRTVKTMSLNITTGDNDFRIDIRDIPAGIYFLKVSGEHIYECRKVVVAH